MSPVTRIISVLLLSIFARVAIAAPSHSGTDNIIKEVIHRRIPTPIHASPTRDAMASACTNGLPASKQHPAGYPITDYTMVTAAASDWTSYAVKQDWNDDHFVSGPHVMSFNHKSDPYGPFKCQYTCNADATCNAYFVWYENVNTDDEYLNCVLFDAIIPPSVFVETNGTITSGAYDRLCNRLS